LLASSSAGQAETGKRTSSVPLRIFAACFTSIMISVHYTNYSPLIDTLKTELHISSGQVGLFSTLLFLGLTVAYLPAGLLVDRFGTRAVLIGATALATVSGVVLPLVPSLSWLLACRFLVGVGTGAAFIAGAGVAASLGRHASLAQGLYGGAIQIGSGMGLLVTPALLHLFGWRGAFLFWSILGMLCTLTWFFVHDNQQRRTSSSIDLKAAVRSPAVWTLGLSHLGTFGLGNAIAAWITAYLIYQYGLPLALAATIGSFMLLTGVIFRPLGGIVLARRIIGAIPLLRMGTIMGSLGVILLALPLRSSALAATGLALITIGSTTPYASVFNSAANLRNVGKGVAQGFLSVLASPTVILGPPLIGLLVDHTGSFTLAFGSILLFGCVAITSSLLAGPAVKRESLASET
ncbi:MAG: MFS transporter, partial [Ktedonobacteraceae bacterium]|nr:MFS transporter [Ktedonobacteraceae bacterium]